MKYPNSKFYYISLIIAGHSSISCNKFEREKTDFSKNLPIISLLLLLPPLPHPLKEKSGRESTVRPHWKFPATPAKADHCQRVSRRKLNDSHVNQLAEKSPSSFTRLAIGLGPTRNNTDYRKSKPFSTFDLYCSKRVTHVCTQEIPVADGWQADTPPLRPDRAPYLSFPR